MSEMGGLDNAGARFDEELNRVRKKLSVETDCLPRFAVEKSGEIGGRWENCRKTYNNVGFCNFRKKKNRTNLDRLIRFFLLTKYSVFVCYSRQAIRPPHYAKHAFAQLCFAGFFYGSESITNGFKYIFTKTLFFSYFDRTFRQKIFILFRYQKTISGFMNCFNINWIAFIIL